MSNKNEITGRIIVLNDTQQFPSGFQKREFVIEELDGKYPQKLKFEAMKEGCDKLDAFRVGQSVTVSYNLRGNEYNGKHYVSLQGWRIEGNGSGGKPQARAADQNGAAPPKAAPAPSEDEESDDIPF